jgi:signal transduction histidine kinase
MVVTNLITFLSYFTICLTLLFLAKRTGRVLNREWRYFVVGFALFIVACGSTHLMDVITTWAPIFWVDAATNVVTALLSAWVCLQLIRRASVIGFSINDYAHRLGDAENEKHRMEASLLSARKLEDWSRMSAIVAHEIANPLDAIQNLLFLIRGSASVTPEIADMAATASAEVTRVLTISRSTLAFFRQTDRPEPVDLLSAAESVRFLLQPMLEKKSIALDIRAENNTVVEAMPGETRQVLLNLIRNACEATTRPGASVTVILQGDAQVVTITVSDQGTGIEAALLPSLFQFGTSTKGDAGNGMGLWTVKHIVQRHGGEIAVRSTAGAGSTFTLHWPRRFGAADRASQLLPA